MEKERGGVGGGKRRARSMSLFMKGEGVFVRDETRRAGRGGRCSTFRPRECMAYVMCDVHFFVVDLVKRFLRKHDAVKDGMFRFLVLVLRRVPAELIQERGREGETKRKGKEKKQPQKRKRKRKRKRQ